MSKRKKQKKSEHDMGIKLFDRPIVVVDFADPIRTDDEIWNARCVDLTLRMQLAADGRRWEAIAWEIKSVRERS